MQDFTEHLAEFTLFLKGTSTPEFEEIDSICVSKEFFNNTFCIRHVLHLDFLITRVSSKTSIAQLKGMFHCGSELAMRVKKAVAERRVIPLRRPGKKPMRNDPSIVRFVDQTTSHNGMSRTVNWPLFWAPAARPSTTSDTTSSTTTRPSATGQF